MPKNHFVNVYAKSEIAAIFSAMALVDMEYYSFHSVVSYDDGSYDVWFELEGEEEVE